MTLKEIAQGYRDASVPLRRRLSELQQALKAAEDPDEIFRLKRRIAELTPMLTECNRAGHLSQQRQPLSASCDQSGTDVPEILTKENQHE